MSKFLLEILNYPNNTPEHIFTRTTRKAKLPGEKKEPRISNKPQGEVKSQIPLDATPLILSLSLSLPNQQSLSPTPSIRNIKHETSFANRAAYITSRKNLSRPPNKEMDAVYNEPVPSLAPPRRKRRKIGGRFARKRDIPVFFSTKGPPTSKPFPPSLPLWQSAVKPVPSEARGDSRPSKADESGRKWPRFESGSCV